MELNYLEYFYAVYSKYQEDHCYGFRLPDLSRSKDNCFFVFNLDCDRCISICSTIKTITGNSFNVYLTKGVLFFKNLIHPLDYSRLISELLTYIFLIREQRDYGCNATEIKVSSCRLRHKNNYWISTCLYFLYIPKTYSRTSNLLTGVIHKTIQDDLIKESGSTDYPLSGREQEVLQLLGNGDSSKIIADKLHISETTAISHRKNIIQKLHVKNTAELIKKAVKNNLIE